MRRPNRLAIISERRRQDAQAAWSRQRNMARQAASATAARTSGS